MIRLVFMTDRNKVIGAADPDQDDARFEMLPPALPEVMKGLYQTRGSVVAGKYSLAAMMSPLFQKNGKFCLTTEEGFEFPDIPDLNVIDDANMLIKAYANPGNEVELLVIGGLTVFELFMPMAHRVDVALASEPIPGDLVLNGWDSGQFSLERAVPWEGGQTLHLVRQ